MGVANHRSIAWSTAHLAKEWGAQVAITYQGERVARKVSALAGKAGIDICLSCDVQSDVEIQSTVKRAAEQLDGLDFIVHSLAFAPSEALSEPFLQTRRSDYQMAVDVSAYSLVSIARAAKPYLSDTGSLIAMTYLGAERVVPKYNVMGPAKAALEANIKYLAYELGPQGIRVNGVSAGPVRTLASAGIPGFRTMLKNAASNAPLRRTVTAEEVASTTLFLASPLSRAITGDVIYVDGGYHIMGFSSHEPNGSAE
ncbi:MAG: enoyl-ACP reductase FabI [Bradymonadia bacterium]